MSEDKNAGRVALMKPVRAIFCNVVIPRKFKENGKEKGDAKYDVTLQLDKDDLDTLKLKALAVAKAAFPGRDLKELRFPFKTAEQMRAKATAKGKDPSIYPEGTFYISARSNFAPTLSHFVNGKPAVLEAAQAEVAKQKFYGGSWVVPQLNFVAYTRKRDDDRDGVTAYLDQLLSVPTPQGKDGGRIGGSANPAETFASYVGTLSSEDPTGGAGVDDEIPF